MLAGGLTFSLSTRAIIVRWGTPWSFRIVAVVTFLVNSACTFLIKDRNKHINPNQRGFDLGVLRRYEFLLIMAWGFFSMLGYIVILFSLPDFAKSRGFTGSQGSIIGALLNLGMAFGRPMVGFFSDRAGRINISWGMTLATGFASFAFWLPADTMGMSIWFAIFAGAVCGTFWTTIAPVW